MNIFIAEDHLEDYLRLKKLIEKWSTKNHVDIKIYYRNQLFYQIPKMIKTCQIAFLDIHMPEINGYEFAKYLRYYNENIEIVFQSYSYLYGAKSYRVKALDYFIKPVQEKDVFRLLDTVFMKKQEKSLIYKKGKMIKKIKFSDIIYIEVDNHRCFFHTLDSKDIAYFSLLKLKKMLDKRFVQCYRSYLVNIYYVKRIEKEEVVLLNNQTIPLSRKYSKILKETFMKQI